MNNRRKWFWLAFIFAAVCLASPFATRAAAQKEPVLVGRIAYIEGQTLRYVPETKDWVIVPKDAPFGLNDALYSDASAKAEFIFPNGLLVRIGASTQIQLIALKADASEMDVASGVARFYNRNANGMLKVTTPFGYVLAEPNSTFDLYVGDQSVEVLALNGQVAYIQQGSNARYEVTPGGGSILADATQVANGEGTLDAQWDDWNAARDTVRTKRAQVKGESVKYVPPQLADDAYDLDESGKWERVEYQGQTREVWQPTVDESWRPFSDGRWTDYYGDQVWVPDESESFGYVTHHYGNWIIVNGRWYWSPPAPVVEVAAGPVIGFGWYPGRVAWVSGGEDVGWVPLAPTEPYYSNNYWGPAVVVVTPGFAPPPIVIGSLAFASAAIVVPQASFYSSPSYRSVRVTNINQTTIINNFHAAPVVNNTVIKNYNQNTARYNFVNKAPTEVPHSSVVQRIGHNQQVANTTAKSVTATSLKQAVTASKIEKPVAKAAVPPPTKLTNKLVAPNQVNAPKDQTTFKTMDMKKNTKPITASPAVKPGVTQPPAPGVTKPPVPGVTQPPAPGVTKPPVPGVTQPPAPGVTRPPASGVTVPSTTHPSAGTTHPGIQSPRTQPPPPTAPGVRPPVPGASQPPSPATRAPATTRPEMRTPTLTQPPATRAPTLTQPPATRAPTVTRPPATRAPVVTQPPATRAPAPATRPEVRTPPATRAPAPAPATRAPAPAPKAAPGTTRPGQKPPPQ